MNSVRVTAIYKVDRCPWRIHASPSPDGLNFMIKTYNETHTYQAVRRTKMATSSWIASKLAPMIKNKKNPEMSMRSNNGMLIDEFGIEVNNMKLYRARHLARGDGESDHATECKLKSFIAM